MSAAPFSSFRETKPLKAELEDKEEGIFVNLFLIKKIIEKVAHVLALLQETIN